MTEKKSRERMRPLVIEEQAETATGTRDAFLSTFFRRGEELVLDMREENERLRKRVQELDDVNARLRAQLASDATVYEALKKIDQLERERYELVSRATEAAAISTRTVAQYSAVENDLANLANLYIAADQLHGTLDLTRVLRHMSELLEQFVGSRAHAIYCIDEAREALVPIEVHGLSRAALAPVSTRPSAEGPASGTRAIEHAFLTGTSVFATHLAQSGPESPAACVPLMLEGRVVGVVVVFSLLAQKDALTANDRELFRMLGAHAATAITGGLLWERAGKKLPGPSGA